MQREYYNEVEVSKRKVVSKGEEQTSWCFWWRMQRSIPKVLGLNEWILYIKHTILWMTSFRERRATISKGCKMKDKSYYFYTNFLEVSVGKKKAPMAWTRGLWNI